MKKELTKEYQSLTEDQKEEALNFMEYTLFKKNVRTITDEYMVQHRVFDFNTFI